MAQKTWGNEYRTMRICIDSYENEVPIGRIYNPYAARGKCFHSLTQLLLEVDDLMDSMNYPQSFTTVRTFAPIQKPGTDPPENEAQEWEGRLATFAVKVLFRQNASWQGSVIWVDTGQEQTFRSALELIFLMNSAMSETQRQVS